MKAEFDPQKVGQEERKQDFSSCARMVNTKLKRVSNALKFAIPNRYCNKELSSREGNLNIFVNEDQLKQRTFT